MTTFDKLLNKTLLHNHNGREVTGGDVGSKVPINSIQFDTTPTAVTPAEGLLNWNSTDGTLDLGMNGGDITMQIGQEIFMKVRNVSDSTIPNGSPVYISGRTGNRPNIYLAKSDSETTSKVIGLTTQDITSPADGFVTTFGYVRQIKTDYSGTGNWGTTWVEGDNLYVSKTVAGQLTNVEPTAPHHSDIVGTVAIVGGVGIGSILVNPQRHKTLEELTDVDGTALTTTGQFPNWNQTTGYFDFDKNINDYTPISLHTDSQDPTGWLHNEDIDISYSATNRTVTLTGDLTYYWKGVKKTLTSPWTSEAHATGDGRFFLYSTDGDTFAWSSDVWKFYHLMIAVARKSTTPAYNFCLRELHGLMPWQVHLELHEQISSYRDSGGALIAGTYAIDTQTDVAITPSFDSAIVRDEDNLTTLPLWAEGTYTHMYIGASSKATFSSGSFPFRFTTAGYINYNTPSTGAETQGATGKFYNVYQLMIPVTDDSDSQAYRMVMLQPQKVHPSLSDAQAEDPRGLSLGDLTPSIPEFVLYARITYGTSAAYGTTGKVVISGVTYLEGSRLGQVSISGFTPENHNDLTGVQGGTVDEYYHMTAAEYAAAQAVPTTYLKLDTSNDPLTGSLEIEGNSARSITVNRHTTANTAGNNLTVTAGGATSGATDKAGGALLLSAGTSTGTGNSLIRFVASTPSTTGTSDNATGVIGQIYKSSSTAYNLVLNNTTTGATANGISIFGGNNAYTGMFRNTTANTSGFSLTVQAGGATSGSTDKAGGNLVLKSGVSTGTATGQIVLQTPTPATTGTSDNTFVTRVTIDSTGVTCSGPLYSTTTREKLTAARTYYVATTGSDSNTGLTVGSPFLTIQKAVDVISTLDINSNVVTIQVANGTYTGGVTLRNVVGYSALGDLVITGDTTTPSNVVISPTATNCFSSRVTSGWLIQGMKLQTTTSGSCLYALAPGAVIQWNDLEFGDCGDYHMRSSTGAYIVQTSSDDAYTISGDADGHFYVSGGANLLVNGNTVTLTGTPAFTTFATCTSSGTMIINANTYSGSATGKRYDVTLNGTVNSGTTLPGDVAGTTATGGQYA